MRSNWQILFGYKAYFLAEYLLLIVLQLSIWSLTLMEFEMLNAGRFFHTVSRMEFGLFMAVKPVGPTRECRFFILLCLLGAIRFSQASCACLR